MIQRHVTHVVIAAGTAERSFSPPGREVALTAGVVCQPETRAALIFCQGPSGPYARLGHAEGPITSRQFLTEEGIGQGVLGETFMHYVFFGELSSIWQTHDLKQSLPFCVVVSG